MKLAFFASHNGSNAQAIMDACATGRIKAQPVLLISNNADSGALARARREKIHAFHLSSKTHSDPAELDSTILDLLVKHEIDLVILAGYMRKLGPLTLTRYWGRVLNIHPALLPKFGGKGMYGMNVHNAVIQSGETETGATVHIATETYDEGPIVAQKRIPVLRSDTPEALATRVLALEHALYVETVAAIARDEITLPIVRAHISH
jgi:phosphoribosylglycinamide formyltransferase-1